MAAFTLDTSGVVEMRVPQFGRPHAREFFRWPDLSPFEQGYVEAMFASFRAEVSMLQYEPMPSSDDGWTISWLTRDAGRKRVSGSFVWFTSRSGEEGRAMAQEYCDRANRITFGFSDLALETLAAIRKDCAAFNLKIGDANHNPGIGAKFFESRQIGFSKFWSLHQADLAAAFPPLTVTRDDGKVYARVAS